MPNEIKMTIGGRLLKGLLDKQLLPTKVYQLAMTGTGVYDAVINAGTTEGSISSFGTITSAGLVIAYNLDTTNYVELGISTGSYFAKMRPSTLPNIITCQATPTLYYKANTAACDFQLIVVEL